MSSMRITVVMCAVTLQLSALIAAETVDDLDRYAGNYGAEKQKTFRIYREGDELRVEPPANQRIGTLIPRSPPGIFELQEAPFEFAFLSDAQGQIIGLEITRPDGQKQRLTRLFDSLAAAKTYAFGNGGYQASAIKDDSIDRMSFEELAHSIAPALAREGYILTTDPEKTDLLIMVYWGATTTEDHPAVIAEKGFNPTSHLFLDQINGINARVLGFQDALNGKAGLEIPGFHSSRAKDLVEESRYWVALVAVDFRSARKDKTIKPLWSIRYNIASRRTAFAAALPQMTQVASHYFGRDSKGLVNRSTTDKQGIIELGEQQVIGVETAD